jgi:glycosyltransferase involved in cell wall biosynthesis
VARLSADANILDPQAMHAEPGDPSMSYRYNFTVFTPSYNRARTLPRVYESLLAQTYRNFEWLIVDDGSNDGTKQLVEGWQAASKIPIRYIYQENRGKPAAMNRGVQEAQGELFLTVDSDDAFVPHALERFQFNWEAIPAAQRHQFSAVTALCQYQDGRLVGNKFPRDILDSDTIEVTLKYKVVGDKWGFQRTDVLKQFPFAVERDGKFVPESLTWFALSRKYKTRYINEILLIVYFDEASGVHLSSLNPTTLSGRLIFHRYVLNELISWLRVAPASIFRSAINFSRYSFGLGRSPSSQMRDLHSLTARLLVGLSLPLGFVMSLRDKRSI